MRHILSILVENEPGVLARVAGLFSGRGYNIETLNVAPTLTEGLSMMTITTTGDEAIIEQIVKQLRKLVTTLKVVDLTEVKSVQREMMLLRVDAEGQKRVEVLRIVDIFRCKVVDVSPDELVLEVTGNQEKLTALINLLQRIGIKEVARTGAVAMKRGMQE
ncbi:MULTISPECIES: acetolactate synthase small subunit [Solidesulfovibrio]|jgi:acetolactate synthase-1/3 small subunit|uniref:Acetolactate synthase small subunit n=2 Tax=Solidesulfovibrio TaxID=2910984 RepID=C4XSF3_SOLM1|nr:MULTISPECIES: acetolactate synthase small subunit [Solidesulfovibrio]QAZ67628.1 acetolactate synthase small subunit [Solidesulfovibrio carbinolicus]BAH75675.1 acetolactate synthase small subunit [Solidesulfovibrio magneticus RS-1]HML53065.1 acetolactate synthase small subunit [Solidesulfovibrio magneticus]